MAPAKKTAVDPEVAKVRVFAAKNEHLIDFYYEAKDENEHVLSVSDGYARREDAVRDATEAYPGVELVFSR